MIEHNNLNYCDNHYNYNSVLSKTIIKIFPSLRGKCPKDKRGAQIRQ